MLQALDALTTIMLHSNNIGVIYSRELPTFFNYFMQAYRFTFYFCNMTIAIALILHKTDDPLISTIPNSIKIFSRIEICLKLIIVLSIDKFFLLVKPKYFWYNDIFSFLVDFNSIA